MKNRLLTLNELCMEFDRSFWTLKRWRNRGCRGFYLRGGRILGDPSAIREWLAETNMMKPGLKVPLEAEVPRPAA